MFDEIKQAIKSNVSEMIKKDGEQLQIDITVEEFGEFLQALMKYGRKQKETYHNEEKIMEARNHLIDEMADIYFMLYTIEELYQIDPCLVEERLRVKCSRLDRKIAGTYCEEKKDE